MISSVVTYAIFGALFVGGVAIGYFVTQQQVNELRFQMVDIVNRVAERNAQIQSLQNEIAEIRNEVRYYKTPIMLEYTKSGGIAGMMQTLKIDEFGNLFVSSNGVEHQSRLSQESITKVKDMLIDRNFFGIFPIVYEPAPGNADFFSYSLTVTMGDVRKQILWVDNWAAKDELPEELLELQAELTAMHDLVIVPVNAHTEIRNGLRLTLKVDKTEYTSEDIIRVSAKLENISPNVITYTSPTPCDFNIRFVVKGNATIHDITYVNWQPVPCTQVLQPREISPSALILQEVEWNQMLPDDTKLSAGVYTIEARFPLADFEEALVSSSVSISVTD